MHKSFRSLAMNRISLVLALGVLASAAPALYAEQQVTLKSGVALVGEVEFDGDALVVTIDDGEHRVPLADVVSVAPLEVGQNEQAQRLLLAGLEARVLGGSPREAVGLLAEAARLAPDDPQIAFWYASTLVDAGSGNAANRILEAHRATLEAAFPDRMEKLAKRINARMIIELLPEELVARLDALSSGTAPQPADPDQRMDYAAFRVVDQFDAPIPRSAIDLQGNFNERNIEEFPDGYFLATFTRHRGQGNEPCQLTVNQDGLMAAQFELRAASGQMFPAEDFIVRRYEDADKRTIRGLVLNRNGNPIVGAQISLQPSNNNDGVDRSQTAATGEDGRVEFTAFPGSYGFSASAPGYSGAGQQVEVPAEGQAPEMRLVLHKAIAANLRIEWRGTPMQGGGFGGPGVAGGEVAGEATLTLDGQGGGGVYNQEVQWLRPNQVQDRLTLNINLMMYGHMQMAGAGGPWVKRRSAEDDEAADDEAERMVAAQEQFDDLDLEDVDELPEEFQSLNVGGPGFGPGNMTAAANFGDIFVGRLVSRDMRNGQPIDMTFKVIVEPLEEDAGE
jgi:hypothetical protein